MLLFLNYYFLYLLFRYPYFSFRQKNTKIANGNGYYYSSKCTNIDYFIFH